MSETLKRIWGFESLRPLQQEVVESSLANRDAVVVMPTGGGKSLCFQLPALLSSSLTVVISPLIALMKDQVDALRVVGVEAAALNSSMEEEEEADTRRKVLRGEMRLLYVSPERLLLSSTLDLLRQAKVARFAVDEAHCISAWGHDFRPEFRQLGRLKELFPEIPVQAFTATATPQVQRDIAIQLRMEKPRRFVGVFDRPNLTYRIVAKDDAVRRTVEAVQRYPDEGVIVYCLSRKDTETIAGALIQHGIEAVAYHAGLPNGTRKRISEDFAQERANIIVATVAFGMGIDRANVRCVIHECLPKSMEGYQQETGRAGRDGLPSECVLLYNHGDILRLKRLLEGGEADLMAHQLKLLEEVRKFATSHQCRHKSLSEYFGQDYAIDSEGCGACDVCLGGMQPLEGATDKAHQILRTVLSLRSKAGVAFIAGVLTGSRAKKISDRSGHLAAGFGAFASEGADRVTAWVHQLLDLGLLVSEEGPYPTISVTQEGRNVLDSGVEVEMIENSALVQPAKARAAKGAIEVPGMDHSLFEVLRAWRKETAQRLAVPAYVILHDATLMRLSAVRPSTIQRLKSLPGIGEKQATSYGDELLELIAASGLAMDQELVVVPKEKVSNLPDSTKKYAASFREGKDPAEVARLHGISERTAWNHLATWIEYEKPETVRWVSEEVFAKVKTALEVTKADLLKPVFEHLNGEVPYEHIQVVRASLR
ncbi:MAG: RecQ family ATP-dependent DNA helicase [Armatimonadota bacterium]